MATDDPDSKPPKPGELRLSALSRRAFLWRTTLTAAAVGVAGSVPGLSSLIAGRDRRSPRCGGERGRRRGRRRWSQRSPRRPRHGPIHRRDQPVPGRAGGRHPRRPDSLAASPHPPAPSGLPIRSHASTTPSLTLSKGTTMSSHREAPEISKDPVADSTDLYAFVSPDDPDTVTLIANYIPLEAPDGGPNFYEFGDGVLYEIHIDNTGDGTARHQLPVPLHHRQQHPGLVPLQRRPHHRADAPVAQVAVEPPADLLAGSCRPWPPLGRPRCRRRSAPACSARRATSGPLSTPNYPALARRRS